MKIPSSRPLSNLERIGQITWNYLGLRDPQQVEEWFRKLRQSGEVKPEPETGEEWKR